MLYPLSYGRNGAEVYWARLAKRTGYRRGMVVLTDAAETPRAVGTRVVVARWSRTHSAVAVMITARRPISTMPLTTSLPPRPSRWSTSCSDTARTQTKTTSATVAATTTARRRAAVPQGDGNRADEREADEDETGDHDGLVLLATLVPAIGVGVASQRLDEVVEHVELAIDQEQSKGHRDRQPDPLDVTLFGFRRSADRGWLAPGTAGQHTRTDGEDERDGVRRDHHPNSDAAHADLRQELRMRRSRRPHHPPQCMGFSRPRDPSRRCGSRAPAPPGR